MTTQIVGPAATAFSIFFPSAEPQSISRPGNSLAKATFSALIFHFFSTDRSIAYLSTGRPSRCHASKPPSIEATFSYPIFFKTCVATALRPPAAQ